MSEFSPKIDQNMKLITDYQIVRQQKIEVMSDFDNVIIIAINQSGLVAYCSYDDFFKARLDKMEKKPEGSADELFWINDMRALVEEFDRFSYFFRFTSSSFVNLPAELITFNFDLLYLNEIVAATIIGENHPVIALSKAIVDLNVNQKDIQAIAISIEYCGEQVFSSPKSLIRYAFRGRLK